MPNGAFGSFGYYGPPPGGFTYRYGPYPWYGGYGGYPGYGGYGSYWWIWAILIFLALLFLCNKDDNNKKSTSNILC